MKHTKKHISLFVMVVLIILFDQITKALAKSLLVSKGIKTFIKGFVQFRYAENTGIAFSMFSGARWVFVALTAVLCVIVLWYLFSNRCNSLWLYWSLGVVVAGGIGNLIDRTIYGYVVDFIEPVFVNFAIFNIADCAVTCGAVSLVACLAVDLFKKDKKGVEKSE